ncbi:hypothetical protein JTB14_031338 [Gonioctena quinquepunctata]|nr:hypothetical protein JTB14_031338 [Gonioctena quinquepunctata]
MSNEAVSPALNLEKCKVVLLDGPAMFIHREPNSKELADVYEDVVDSLTSWGQTRKVALLSSDKAEDQQAMLVNAKSGDISKHIVKSFQRSDDKEAKDVIFRNIAKELEVNTEEIIFVTCDIEGAKAAKSASLVSVVISREGQDPLPQESVKEFPTISCFKGINFENQLKRKSKDEVVLAEEPPAKVAKTDGVEENKPSDEKPMEEATAEKGSVDVAQSVEKIEGESMEVDTPDLEGKSKAEEKVAEKTDPKKSAESEKLAEPEKVAKPEKVSVAKTEKAAEPEKATEPEKAAETKKAAEPEKAGAQKSCTA